MIDKIATNQILAVSLIQKRWGVSSFLVHKVNWYSISSDCPLSLYHKNIKKRNKNKKVEKDKLNK